MKPGLITEAGTKTIGRNAGGFSIHMILTCMHAHGMNKVSEVSHMTDKKI